MTSFDFSRLTPAQRELLTWGGWRVSDARSRQQPGRSTVKKLIERGLVIEHKNQRGAFFTVLEYEVPEDVLTAWRVRCAAMPRRRRAS